MDRRKPAVRLTALYDLEVRAVQAALQTEQRISKCPVCFTETARPRFEAEGLAWQVVVCTNCGLGRSHSMPSAEDMCELYPDEYYGEPGARFHPWVEKLVRFVSERHIRFLTRGLSTTARILDVGCGQGVVLGALAARGFEIHGQEISVNAIRGADSRAEIRIASNLVEAGYEAETFDQIIIWHVLEHLHDPRAVLEEAHRILKPGGRLVVATPNFSSLQALWSGPAWFHLDLPRHLYHFPLRALRRILSETGFQIGNEYHFSLRQNAFGWIQSALNRFSSFSRNGLYILVHRLQPSEPPPFDSRTRGWLWFWLIAGAPIALALAAFAAALRSGATVHVVARR